MISFRPIAALVLCALVSAPVLHAQSTWTSLGGPFGGRTYAVANGPAAKVFLGGEQGVFVSTNAGAQWLPTDVRGPACLSFSVSGMALCAGTIAGVYSSNDGGASWSAPMSTNLFTTWALASSGQTVYAGTDLTTSSPGNGIAAAMYRSLDGGLTWTDFSAGLPQDIVYAIAILQSGDVMAGTGSGIFRLTPGANRWVADGPASSIYALVEIHDTLYAGTDQGVIVRLGRGTWSAAGTMTDGVYALSGIPGGVCAGTTTGAYTYTVRTGSWASTTLTGQTVYGLSGDGSSGLFAAVYGGNGVYQSLDDGATWRVRNNGYEAQLYALACDSIDVYAGGVGGVFRYSGASASWSLAGLTGVVTNGLTVLAPEIVIAATDSGVFITNNAGQTWVSAGLASRSVYATIPIGGQLVVGTDSGIYTMTLPQLTASTTPMLPGTSVIDLTVSPGQALYAATDNGVYQSIDLGSTWYPAGISGGLVWQVGVRTEGDLVAATDLGLFRSLDTSRTWNVVALLDSSTLSVVVDAAGRVYAASNYGVVTSPSGGAPYASMNAGFADSVVVRLALDQFRHIDALTRSGVYRMSLPATGVEEGPLAPSRSGLVLQCAPNPVISAARFTVTAPLAGAIDLRIYDVLGREVAHAKGLSINLASLPAGAYLARVTVGSTTVGSVTVVRE